jgi:16S rRNA C1402 (ribose-2'-O) methylase RsmI
MADPQHLELDLPTNCSEDLPKGRFEGDGLQPVHSHQPGDPGALAPEGTSSHTKPLAPGLYLVATPIGNLEDITLRALRVLRSVDRIACEDTRQTAKLLHHFGIRTPTVSYHTHNETARSSELIAALRAGGRIAIVSDAGMPGIADPGATIAAVAIAAGIAVYPIPGANAALTALIASGLNAERFTFHGFLPSKEGQRRTTLEALRNQLPQAFSPATTQVPQDFSLGSHSPLEKERGFSPDEAQVPQGFSLGSHSPSETARAFSPGEAQVPQGFSLGSHSPLEKERGFSPGEAQVPQGFSLGSHRPVEKERGFSPREAQVPQDFSLGSHRPVEKERGFSPGEAPTTHIFYETPHRILSALADIVAIFGPAQPLVLARELTKLHEEFLRGTAAAILATLTARSSIRGEMVLLLELSPQTPTDIPQQTLAEEVAALIIAESLSEKDALKRVAKSRNISKSDAYREWQRSQSRKR